MNSHIFREYDIRGIAETDLSDDVARAIGRSYGSVVRGDSDGARVAVGRDGRLSSPRLSRALTEGINSAGVDVVDVGLVPTPCLYHTIHHLGVDGGVMVTGSHNPGHMNGFKLSKGTASIYGEAITDLERRIRESELASGGGEREEIDGLTPYLAALASRIELARPLKIVLDAGNGSGGPAAEEFLRGLGVDLIPLFCEPDGSFPNHPADPTVLSNLDDLIRTVRETGADLGIGLDGDADRVGVVDNLGRVLWGDRLLALFARELLGGAHPGAPVIFEVKCSQALVEDIEAHGGRPIMWKTGHSLIKSKMKETAAPLAGEMSGHMFFADEYFGYDDGIYAAGRIARLLAGDSRPLSEIADTVPNYSCTPELRVECADSRKFAVVDEVLDHFRDGREVVDIDGARILFGDGWGLVRASNTQPVLVLRFEARTPDRMREIAAEVLSFLGGLDGVDVSSVEL
ncbi:MAG: phosphomannomutase [Gemmatimonadetes bacterium]|nr:phosphomannomutase [Gemmatimonadota bacterium]